MYIWGIPLGFGNYMYIKGKEQWLCLRVQPIVAISLFCFFFILSKVTFSFSEGIL